MTPKSNIFPLPLNGRRVFSRGRRRNFFSCRVLSVRGSFYLRCSRATFLSARGEPRSQPQAAVPCRSLSNVGCCRSLFADSRAVRGRIGQAQDTEQAPIQLAVSHQRLALGRMAAELVCVNSDRVSSPSPASSFRSLSQADTARRRSWPCFSPAVYRRQVYLSRSNIIIISGA